MNKAEDEVSFALLAAIASVLLFGGAAVKPFIGNPLLSVLIAGLIGVALTAIFSFIGDADFFPRNATLVKKAAKQFYLALVSPLFVIKGATTRLNEQRSLGQNIKWTTAALSTATSMIISLFLSALALMAIWMVGVAAYFAGKHIIS